MSRLKALAYYVLTRILLAPLMLWTIATFVFLLMRATPGASGSLLNSVVDNFFQVVESVGSRFSIRYPGCKNLCTQRAMIKQQQYEPTSGALFESRLNS